MKKPILNETDWVIIKAYADCGMNEAETAKTTNFSYSNIRYHLDKVYYATDLNPRKFHDLKYLLEHVEGVIERMTALEYMERELKKHQMNYKREFDRGVPQVQLDNIANKIKYYQEAVDAMKMLRMVIDNGKI